MFWTIVGAILFVFIGIPLILNGLAFFLNGVGELFISIAKFPGKVVKVYKKEGMKGLFSLFGFVIAILDYFMAMIGAMGIGIAIFASESREHPFRALLLFLFSCALLVCAIWIGIKLYKNEKTNEKHS
ncbi:MAG: hypothetical protein KBT14_02225 [Proteobacteria bacterium]|nr:hypothetical protein [Candidatus Enterousia onthequi]